MVGKRPLLPDCTITRVDRAPRCTAGGTTLVRRPAAAKVALLATPLKRSAPAALPGPRAAP
jgi:hypothetical protein